MIEKKGEEQNEKNILEKRKDVRPSCGLPSINLYCC